MTSDEARIADVEDRRDEAIRGYEALISEGVANAEDILDLAILYWTLTDLGADAPVALAHHAARRCDELLELFDARYPGHPAGEFWRRYIDYQDLNEPFTLEECRAMLRRAPDYLEPAIVVFAETYGHEGVNQARQLLARSRTTPTARSRYVARTLEAAAIWAGVSLEP